MTAVKADRYRQALTVIDGFDRSDCVDNWRQVFGRSPPKHLSVQFMKRVLLWSAQTSHLGGVSKATQRTMKAIARGKTAPPIAKPGAQLIREWNGRTYQVQIADDGYTMDGKNWRSLSAIAKHITGAHWSGPRFFGLSG